MFNERRAPVMNGRNTNNSFEILFEIHENIVCVCGCVVCWSDSHVLEGGDYVTWACKNGPGMVAWHGLARWAFPVLSNCACTEWQQICRPLNHVIACGNMVVGQEKSEHAHNQIPNRSNKTFDIFHEIQLLWKGLISSCMLNFFLLSFLCFRFRFPVFRFFFFCPFVFLAFLSVHYLSPCSVLLSVPPFFLTYTNTHFPIFFSHTYRNSQTTHTNTLWTATHAHTHARMQK